MVQLNEQFRRMQVLAGIITEEQLNEAIEDSNFIKKGAIVPTRDIKFEPKAGINNNMNLPPVIEAGEIIYDAYINTAGYALVNFIYLIPPGSYKPLEEVEPNTEERLTPLTNEEKEKVTDLYNRLKDHLTVV